jgi:hypothetical protein
MTNHVYDFCVPGTIRILESTAAIIDKAAAHCAARKIDPTLLAAYRLAPDMHPFSRQIQIMTDQAKGMGARLAGVEVPSYQDTETTFDELKTRLQKTADFLRGLKAEQFAGAADKPIVLKFGPREVTFASGIEYATKSVFPNLYFHATTAYNILRSAGVEIGKRDYLGS